MRKELGKIKSISIGYGGYQDCQFGVFIELGGKGWGVGDCRAYWGRAIQWNKECKWTEEDRAQAFGEALAWLDDLIIQAKKRNATELVGIPVEVTFDGNMLKSWRILTEVI